jgi:DNA-binding LytR/AlgR family response regulator
MPLLEPVHPSPPTAIIADDEPILRLELRSQLAEFWPALQIVAEVADGQSALLACRRERTDIAFLDIRMPRIDGMSAAAQLGGALHVVLLTAYESCALQAFGRRAIDYLLKPVQRDRLSDTVERLQRLVRAQHDVSALRGELEQRPPQLPPLRVSVGRTTKWLSPLDVLYVESAAGDTRVLTADAESFIRGSLDALLRRFAPRFVRVHRGAIVQRAKIAALRTSAARQATVQLESGHTLVVSRACRRALRARI